MRNRLSLALATVTLALTVMAGCTHKPELVPQEHAVPQTTPSATEQITKKDTQPPVVQQDVKEPSPVVSSSAASEELNPVISSTIPATNLGTVYFEYDKSDIREDSQIVLTNNAAVISGDKKRGKVQIAGHCDERGSAEYNLALGERRAKAVMQYLITLGVPADLLTVVSYGKEKPAVEGSNEEAWAKNRRAEFMLIQ